MEEIEIVAGSEIVIKTMLDIILVVLVISTIAVSLRMYFGTRILSAICAGFVLGWIVSGLLIRLSGEYEDFDSMVLTDRRFIYQIVGSIAILLLMIHLVVVLHRESQRVRGARVPGSGRHK